MQSREQSLQQLIQKMKQNKITSIEVQKKQRGRFSVFIDGEFSFGISDIDLYNLGLAVGDVVTEEQMALIEETIDVQKCRDYAVNLVSKKMYTKKEIAEKMQKKGFSKTATDGVMDILEEYGYVNDDLYAEMYCEYQSRKFGAKKIRYDLQMKGISQEIIQKHICKIENRDELMELVKLKIKGKTVDIKERQKIVRHFLSKGFDYDAVKSCIDSVCGNETEDYE